MEPGANPDATSSTTTDNAGGQTSPTTTDDFEPITSAAQFAAVLKPRLERERNKYRDYDELKAKAARLDELEEANKSEVQKLSDKLANIERERDEAHAFATRLAVAAEYGISREDAELFLTGTDEPTLKKQAQRLADRDAERKKNGNVVPREGSTPKVADNDERAAARALFGGST